MECFASSAQSELGESALRSLKPFSGQDGVIRRQALILEYRRYLSLYGSFPWSAGVREVTPFLDGARSSGIMAGEELLLVRALLEAAARIKDAVLGAGDEFKELASLAGRIRDFSGETEALSVVDDHGLLEDGASPVLRNIREKIGELKKRIRKEGNSVINGGLSHMLQERILSLRDGRFLFLVRQEFVGRFPGILVDRSSTGNSAYMEFGSMIPLNNKMADLKRDEVHEERRILRELTSMLLSRQSAISDAQNALGTADMLYAVSRVMDGRKWILPEVAAGSSFRLLGARHPLLGEKAVPIDIHCGGTFRILVITGPNTGGKTVALKTVGVAVILAWLGLPIPAAEGSRIGDISSVYADIGDEQSIQQSLSTFSAHLKKIIDLLDRADKNSLILLDELGAGTDPQEGAALGVALLKTLGKKGPLVLATTHHNPIKKFAVSTRGVETASVDFDVQTLTPTYRLVMGVPGVSNAIAIAKRLGMKEEVLMEAQKALSSGEASVEVMIEELRKKSLALESAEALLAREKADLEAREKALEAEKRNIDRARRRSIIKADKEAERIVDEAQGKAVAMLRDMEEASKSAAHREMGRHKTDLDRSRERSRVRHAALEAKDLKDTAAKELVPGDVVQISGSAVPGEILSLDGRKATVLMGGLRVEVDRKKLVPSEKKLRPELSGPAITADRPAGVPSSIMVRGMTVDEAMPLVSDYLDKAFRAGYGEVTVIHGRGEGILRRKVHELCRRLSYVTAFRLGENGEGGYGVTIVSFR